MCTYACLYMCTCIHMKCVYLYMCTCIHMKCVSVHVHMYTHEVCISVHVHMYTHEVCISVHVHMYTHEVCVSVHVHMYTHEVCISVHVHMYTHEVCVSVHVHMYTHEVCASECYATTVWCCTHCVMCQLHPLHRQCERSITVLSSPQLTVHPILEALALGGHFSHAPQSLCRLKGRGTTSPHSHLPPPRLCPSPVAVPTQGIQSWCVSFTHFGGHTHTYR